ncbi:MAG: Ig-like domain-containing protein [Bacteroidales bacterium]|nr:Ig-like domain-containing protein [Bacteroidales bacterium]
MKKQFLLSLSILLMIFGAAIAQDQIPGTIPQNADVQTMDAPEENGLTPLYSVTGQYYLSADGAGANADYTVNVNKPSVLATVHKAYLMAAPIWGTSVINNGCITLNGSPINWDGSIPNALNGTNYYADVTDLIASALNPAAPGITSLPVTECNTPYIDGVALLVIFADPTAIEETIVIMFGAQAFDGDTFSIALGEPINPDDPNAILNMGLGISYSYQIGGVQQYSIIDINGERLTTSAGGEDDGASVNGALMTVGGLGDLNDNPADPYATPTGPRSDDELYSLLPFIDINTTNITAFTSNPSNDDNIFLAYFEISGAAIIGEGILLSQDNGNPDVGTDHTIKAVIQDNEGNPVVDKMVDFEVASGPNSGLSFSAATNAAGEAFFVYNSAVAGVDIVVACFENSQLVTQCSNALSVNWTLAEGESIVLSQAVNNLPIGSTHTVTATLEDEENNPLEGVTVDFEVIAGPNAGNTFSAVTDANGQAMYSYVGNFPGVDQIQACFLNSLTLIQCSNVLNFQWTGELEGYQLCIPEGWSIISSPYEPFDADLDVIFGQLADEDKLVMLLNRGGFYWPAQNVNLLGDWNTNQAYKVKMNEEGCALFSEVPLTDLSVTLANGVDYLPVLVDENVNAAGFFAQLSGNLVYAFDIYNGFVFWPAGGIFTLQTLVPGKGYLVNLSSAAVAYYDYPEAVTTNNNQPIPAISGAPWTVTRTGSAHLISIAAAAMQTFEAGDIIAAFNSQQQCVGMTQYLGNNENLLLTAYGDDMTTEAIDGLTEGENISFKVYDQSEGTIREVTATYNMQMPNSGNYVEFGASGILAFKGAATAIGDEQAATIQVYPNPATDMINVTGFAAETQIILTNTQGQMVFNSNAAAGATVQIDLNGLSSGVYLLQTKAADQSSVQKIFIK